MQPVLTKERIVEQEVMQLAFSLDRAAPLARTGSRAIEVDFPVAEISRLAKIESYRRNIYRAAYYIHKWWARRAGATFRAILLGALLPEGESPMDYFYQANSFEDVVILDPFMGGGTTVGEALRLGVRVIGVDINPVSWFLVKKIVEPISIGALDTAFNRLEATVGGEIRRLYETRCPECGGMAQAMYTYWVSLIPCRTCRGMVPLRKSMILARHMSKPNTGLVTCLRCGHPYVSSTLDQSQCCPACGAAFDAHQGFSKGASYICPACGTSDQIVRTLREQDKPPARAMVAIHFYCETCGKGYKKPDTQERNTIPSLLHRPPIGLARPSETSGKARAQSLTWIR
jgi:DNA-directed RNA polymerase subunit M/transcription elongation factor TFIIS